MRHDLAELEVLISEDLAPVFWRPDLLDKPSAWFGHIPFAHWVIATSVPRVVVELGCHAGVSYSAFCAAVMNKRAGTRCYAIDTWEGDEHAGHYSDQVFEELDKFNREHYGHFSSLLKCTFDEGLRYFEENSVDILHIDGLHTYEAVKHDFLSWESKLSDRAVVLFHDINERREGFGVWRFWAEIRQHHPSFEFLHSHGLGVLAVGKAAPDAVLALCGVGEGKAAVIRDRFQKLGSPWVLEAQLGRERINNEAQRRKIIAEKSFAVKQVREELEPVIQEHLKTAGEMKQQISVLNDQLNEQVRLSEVAKQQAVSVEDELKAQIKTKEVEASMALGRLADAQLLITTLEREKSAMLSSTPWRVGQSLHSLVKRMPHSARQGLRPFVKPARWLMTPMAMPERLRQRRVYRTLASSPLFDPGWYYEQYPDVARASIDPLLHYITAGAKEGRNPSAAFNTSFYTAQCPDVVAAGVNPLYHYVRYGQAEGRQISPYMTDGSFSHVSPSASMASNSGSYIFSEIERSSSIEGDVKLRLSIANRLADIDKYKKEILNYIDEREARNRQGVKDKKIAIYTVILNNYDSVKLPEKLDSRLDYILFTDRPVRNNGVWQVRPITYFHADPTRTCRYVKTHPHFLMPEYEIVIWMDSSLMITGDIFPIVDRFLDSGMSVGAIRHPFRSSIYDEVKACSVGNRDDIAVMQEQVAAYHKEGFDHEDLIESGLMMFKLTDERTPRLLDLWWREIDRYSKRDQLSLNYVIGKSSIEWFQLVDPPYSVRNHPEFVFVRHDASNGPAGILTEALRGPVIDPYAGPTYSEIKDERILAQRDRAVDVVVCVHNALADVKTCLESVSRARKNNQHKLIIIDDGSNDETAAFLHDFSADLDWVEVNRNEQAQGYTKAANKGLRLSTAEFVILLNSDTIVVEGWLEKMADAVFSTPRAGIVGPMSNSASHQSLPEHKSSNGQTAINVLPCMLTVDLMNKYCEQWTTVPVLPLVPLVHGFCFGIRRNVIDTIGYFDEDNFSRGYGEENDYCFRAVDAGFNLVIATHTYVFHAKSKSYIDAERKLLMRAGSEALTRLYGATRIQRAVKSMDDNMLFINIRERARLVMSLPRFHRPRLLLWPVLTKKATPVGSAYVRLLQPFSYVELGSKVQVSSHIGYGFPTPGCAEAVYLHRDMAHINFDGFDFWVKRWKACQGRIIYDLDDDLLDAIGMFKRTQRSDEELAALKLRVMTLLDAADVITVSTPALKASLRNHGIERDIVLLGNCIDTQIWALKQPPSYESDGSTTRPVRIVYIGTPTHDQDLQIVAEAMRRIEVEFSDKVEIEVVGAFEGREPLFGRKVALPEDCTYPNFVNWLNARADWDIGIIPLQDDEFNRSKSFIKFLEYSALGLAIVCSNVEAYASIGRNGKNALMVPNDSESWYDAIQELILHKGLRNSLAAEAQRDLHDNYSLKSNVNRYHDVLNKLFSS